MAESLCCQAVLKKLRQQLAEEERKLRCDMVMPLPICVNVPWHSIAFALAERSHIWYFDISALHVSIMFFMSRFFTRTAGCQINIDRKRLST